ncbi:MAG: ThiF family adenylyltransferase [Burkholderiales bacterium]
MSHQLIALNPDLQKLRDEGYDIEIRGGYLLVKDVPYVAANLVVRRGTLVSKLELAGDLTVPPTDHVAYWIGDHPCHSTGARIGTFENPSPPQDLGGGLHVNHTFSAKAAYRDYHHKMTTYLGRIVGEAQKIDPAATSQTFPVYAAEESESVFRYLDTASSRVNIVALNKRFDAQRIGIIGLGGTGAYVLDFVAKTGVKEIHLFDGDLFLQHNAFRAPGAASIDDLRAKQQKVTHWARVYDAMRRGVIAHEGYLDESSASVLEGLDFVFVCVDNGEAKSSLLAALEAYGLPFIDVGLGIVRSEDQLSGLLRVSTSTTRTRAQARAHIPLVETDAGENEYSNNIQIAELNALNAALAVVRWKKVLGYYGDDTRDYYCGYSIRANDIVNETADDATGID